MEAELLLAHVLGQPRAWLYAHPEHCLEASERACLQYLIERRAEEVPLEYLTGRASFHDIELLVTPDVLVPRPETEVLVNEALVALRDWPDAWVADIGTGSGAVALALARSLPRLRAVATDTSLAALRVAARNVQALRAGDRVFLVNCDLLSAIGCAFSVVVANLPYVSTEDLDGKAAHVVRHEPREALDGGPGGLQTIGRLLKQLRTHLVSGGLALVEIGSGQGASAARMAREALPGAEVDVLPDQWGRDRILRVRVAS